MKTKPIILFLFLFAITLTQSLSATFPRRADSTACAAVDDEELPNDAVEEPAQYPGGPKAMLDFIGEHLEYPQQALQDKIFGKVVLRFIIKEDGGVGDVEILKSLSPECDQAAIRAVKNLPKFTPARNDGDRVRVWFTTPITFILQEPAIYPGGEEALLVFIHKNIVYPKKALEKNISGKVVLRYQVKSDGTIGDIKIQQSLTPECDSAAVDVVRKLDRFIPATYNGKPVDVWNTLPIAFVIYSGRHGDYQPPQRHVANSELRLALGASPVNNIEVSTHYELCEGMEVGKLSSFPACPAGGLAMVSASIKGELIKLPEPSTAGLCTVTALITEEGKLSDISVEQSISQEYDNVILKILSENLGDFSAARDINGRPVPMWLKVNVSYTN